MKIKEGYIPFKDYKTYYKLVGESRPGKLPLLVLHGGPGSAHNYMLSLAELANERQVVFYDQLGCGRSDMPDDYDLWTVELFLQELKTVRAELELADIHLLGQSWGGMLAIEYMLTKPKGVHSLILASSMISIPLYMKEAERLKKELPKEAWLTMKTHEAAGTTASTAYQDAYKEYASRHLSRHGETPKEYQRPEGGFGQVPYVKLWGPSEAYASGELRDWNRIKDLQQISLPTLITSGRYDELTPLQAEMAAKRIKGSKQVIFEDSAHVAHIEEKVKYNRVVEDFLEDVEATEQH